MRVGLVSRLGRTWPQVSRFATLTPLSHKRVHLYVGAEEKRNFLCHQALRRNTPYHATPAPCLQICPSCTFATNLYLGDTDMRLTSVHTVFAVLLIASPAAGQLCEATVPLGVGSPANLHAGASFFDGGKTYVGGVTFGSQVYGGASLGYTDFDDTDLSLKAIGGKVGMDVSSDNDALSVCPRFSAGYEFGLEIAGVDITAWSVAPGVAIGVRSDVSPSVAVMPAGMASLIHTQAKADAGIGGEYDDSETYGLLSAGLGFLFNDRLSFTPAVSVPVGLDGGDATFGVSMGIALGGSR
jgi:hypothetical protein